PRGGFGRRSGPWRWGRGGRSVAPAAAEPITAPEHAGPDRFCFRVKTEVPPASARRTKLRFVVMGLSSLCFGLNKPFLSGFSRGVPARFQGEKPFTTARAPPC